MQLARRPPTERVSYARQPADKQRRLREATSRQGKQAMGRDQPTRNSSYVTRSADKERKLQGATSRQGTQATGNRLPSRGRSCYLRQPVSRQCNVRGPRVQALTFAASPIVPHPRPRQTTRTPSAYFSSFARISIAELEIGIDPTCLADVNWGCP